MKAVGRFLGAGLASVLMLAAGIGVASAQADRPPPAGDLAMPDLSKGSSRELYLQLIGQLRASGRAHAALAHLDAYDRKHARDPRAGLLRADCLTDIGDYAGAQAIYRQLVRTKLAAEAYAGLGRAAGLQDDWAQAAQNFAEASKRAPVSTGYLNDLGYALLRAGDATTAVFRLRQAAELAPGDARVRNNLILALEAAGQADAARRLLAEVRDPADRQALSEARQALRAAARPAPEAQPRTDGAP